jgi:hypothetical protein
MEEGRRGEGRRGIRGEEIGSGNAA